MMKDFHAGRNRKMNPLGRSGNTGQNLSGESDGVQDTRSCLEGVSTPIIMKYDGTPASITGNEIVVDCVASEHVVGKSTLLSDIQQLPEIQNELPNCWRIAFELQGSLPFRIALEQLTLSSMYCMPA